MALLQCVALFRSPGVDHHDFARIADVLSGSDDASRGTDVEPGAVVDVPVGLGDLDDDDAVRRPGHYRGEVRQVLARRPRFALRPLLSLRPRSALESLLALWALFALDSLLSLWALFASRSLLALGAFGARRGLDQGDFRIHEFVQLFRGGTAGRGGHGRREEEGEQRRKARPFRGAAHAVNSPYRVTWAWYKLAPSHNGYNQRDIIPPKISPLRYFYDELCNFL